MLIYKQDAREKHKEHRNRVQYECDTKCVTQMLDESVIMTCDSATLDRRISEYAQQRQERIEAFIHHIRRKHRSYLEQACPHF